MTVKDELIDMGCPERVAQGIAGSDKTTINKFLNMIAAFGGWGKLPLKIRQNKEIEYADS